MLSWLNSWLWLVHWLLICPWLLIHSYPMMASPGAAFSTQLHNFKFHNLAWSHVYADTSSDWGPLLAQPVLDPQAMLILTTKQILSTLSHFLLITYPKYHVTVSKTYFDCIHLKISNCFCHVINFTLHIWLSSCLTFRLNSTFWNVSQGHLLSSLESILDVDIISAIILQVVLLYSFANKNVAKLYSKFLSILSPKFRLVWA